MRSRLLPLAVLPAAIFLVLASTFSSAAVQNRIATVRAGTRASIPNTVPHRARVANDLGEAPSNRKLDSLTLTFSMTDAQQAALTQLLIDQQNPSSPRYHQWLTPAQFGAQFGLSSADLAQVISWLTSQGFTITSTAPGANSITFSGTVAQAQAAFGITIHSLSFNGEAHISNLSDPVLPAAIASVVTHISGLNDFKPKARARTRLVKPQAADTTGLHPEFTSSISLNHYIAPGDFYAIYNVKPLITSSITGQGITIAVAGQTDILTSDVTAFRTASGLCTVVNSTTCPNPLPTVHLLGTDPGLRVSSGDLEEASLDVEWAGAVAPNANVLYVNSGTNGGVFDALIYAITANAAPIISISYGDCEANFGASSLTAFNQYFQQANAQGQTIVGPSGDSGATDCDFDSGTAVGGLAVDFPSSSPYVTSAGGTMFNEGSATGATSYWSSNNSSATNNSGSAVGYIPEAVWNESSASAGLGAGGGGASAVFTKPYWQLGTPADFARDVPDIALNAASNHDATLYCTNGSCINGTYYGSGGFLSTVGGTSVATPSFAGILALVEQKIGARIGNAGPVIYALANSNTYAATVFNDVTTGNNDSPCQAGTPNCPTGGSIGFNAGVHYDLATGWGSVNAYNLANAWNQVTPIGFSGGTGQNISTTTVTTSTAICGVVNPTLSLTVRVTSTVSNNTPIGSVQILIDNAVPTTPVTGTLSGGSVTLSVSTAGYSSGSHTITAVYSGDTVNAASKGYITTDVVSSSAPDFSFTPCTATMSALPGASTSATVFTVAPVNGFTGTVTLTATSTDSVNANFTFTPASISITSTASATTSFVLQAFVSQAVTGIGQFRLKKAAMQEPPRAPWYAAGSGMALASVMLLVLPRRRRWSALLAVMLSIGILGSAIGCASSSNTGGGTTTTPGTTNAAPGTYNVLVTASSTTTAGTVTHSSNVTFVVQ